MTAEQAGVFELTDEEYFADPVPGGSLSSTGVRELLKCPAKFRHTQLYGRTIKREFDVGHAAHNLVLGSGPKLVRIDADEWRAKAVKEEVAEVRACGAVPLRPKDWDAVHAMATSLREDRNAMWLLSRGAPERTLIWPDDATGVMCRAKADWLRPDGVVDYKTCDSADPEQLRRSVHNYGYYIQAAFYLRGFRRLLPVEVPFFAFIAQEKEPPYLVTTFQLTDRAVAHGDRRCAEALERYRDCQVAGEWPGYTADIEDIDLPAYVRTEEY